MKGLDMSAECIVKIVILIICYLGMGFICSIGSVKLIGFKNKEDLFFLIIIHFLIWPLVVLLIWPFDILNKLKMSEKIVNFYRKYNSE